MPQGSVPSGGTRVTANAALKANKGTVFSIILEPKASTGYLKLYNGSDATGTLVLHVATPAGGDAFSISLGGDGLKCPSGIYAEISNAEAWVHHS